MIEKMIFGPELVQSVLYRLTEEFSKKSVVGKSIKQNGKRPIELIRITPTGVIRIGKPI